MPKRARELSPLAVSRLTKPGLHAVGSPAGLYLQISERGARSWILRTMIGGRRRDMGLGAYPDVPLALAREKARQRREQIENGIDPIAERKAARASLKSEAARSVTFDEVARRVIAKKTPEFRNAKHAAQWPSTLSTYASPVIGTLPVDQIELGHITEILTPIWHTKTETATRLRQRIETVLDYATTHGLRSGPNPARWKGHLDHVLSKPGKIRRVRHHPALPIDETPGFFSELRQRDGMAAKALAFTILTAIRSNEVRAAEWSEIDLEGRLWTIPAERMKMENEHRVPLSDEAIAILRALPRMAGQELVFPAPRGSQMSDATLSAVIKRMHERAVAEGRAGWLDPKQGRIVVPHGFRSTFRDWCSERTSYPRDVAEMALAHAIGDKVEAAYRRGDLMEKRRRMMAEWARFCSTARPEAEVVAIRSRG